MSAAAGLGGGGFGRRKGERGWSAAGPNIAAWRRGFAVFSTLHRRLCFCPFPGGARAPLPPRHPRSGRTNKAPFGGGACPARARSMGEATRRASRTPTPLPPAGGPGGRTWVGRAAPGSRAGARAEGGGAQLGGPGHPARRRGYGQRCCPLSPRLPQARYPSPGRRRQVGPICSHTPGGGRVRRRAGLPAASPLLSACVDRRPSRLHGDSPPPRPGSAVLVCPQLSSFSSLELLRPLYLEEDWGGFTEHHRRFGHLAVKLS